MLRYSLLVFLLLLPALASAQTLLVEPYLQSASPIDIWVMWESDTNTESRVDWGLTTALENTTTGSAQGTLGLTQIHEVHLTGLRAANRYYYRVTTGGAQSSIYEFVTPPEASSEQGFRLVAMSDMQRSAADPDKYREVVEDGIVGYWGNEFSTDLAMDLAMVLVPGDLVDNGWAYAQWRNQFFGPGSALMPYVPFYPVPGNHEADTPAFFSYFHLPTNGSPGFIEHWWYKDYSNLRVVGLDSNGLYRNQIQLDWLDGVLADACDNELIDFVFAQLHHPYKSELWLPGELDYTGEVITRLELFTSSCSKPSIHFFGHTHGYSRGQSRDHEHLWVNVASAGGALDNWGEFPQTDYDEFTVTQDEWGFVVVEVEAGDDPGFHLRRVSRGGDNEPMDNLIRDEVSVRRYNQSPQQPSAVAPVEVQVLPECVTLKGSAFSDPDGDAWGAAHWQIAEDCLSFDAPLWERWLQNENWYFDKNTAAGDDLIDEVFTDLEAQRAYCWRVRYRDRALAWSEWSEATPFETGESLRSPNLLINPGAEDGTQGWIVDTDYVESLAAGECNGISPHGGQRYFAVGGLCDSNAFAQAHQRVDLSTWADKIDSGVLNAWYGGWLANWSGDDEPELEVVFLDVDENELGRSGRLNHEGNPWTLVEGQMLLPNGARFIDFVLTGTRNAGTDNDSYMDDLYLRVGIDKELDCGPLGVDKEKPPEPPVPPPVEEKVEVSGCGGCGNQGAGGPGQPIILIALLLLSATFRRRMFWVGGH